MTWLYILAAFLFACLCVFGVMLWLAPEGHENADGFHYGPEDR